MLPMRFIPRLCKCLSSIAKSPSKNGLRVLIKSSSTLPMLVITASTNRSSHNCANSSRNPDETMLDVNVRKTVAFARFISRMTSTAFPSSLGCSPAKRICATKTEAACPLVILIPFTVSAIFFTHPFHHAKTRAFRRKTLFNYAPRFPRVERLARENVHVSRMEFGESVDAHVRLGNHDESRKPFIQNRFYFFHYRLTFFSLFPIFRPLIQEGQDELPAREFCRRAVLQIQNQVRSKRTHNGRSKARVKLFRSPITQVERQNRSKVNPIARVNA